MVNGRRLGGSFTKVTELDITPAAEIVRTQFAGEPRESGDLDMRGYEYSFKTHVERHDWFDLWKQIEQAEENGEELPAVSLAVTYRYRGAPLKTVTLHGDCILKLDKGGSWSDAGEYIPAEWSGFCQRADGI
jgi:hypothetical protein